MLLPAPAAPDSHMQAAHPSQWLPPASSSMCWQPAHASRYRTEQALSWCRRTWDAEWLTHLWVPPLRLSLERPRVPCRWPVPHLQASCTHCWALLSLQDGLVSAHLDDPVGGQAHALQLQLRILLLFLALCIWHLHAACSKLYAAGLCCVLPTAATRTPALRQLPGMWLALDPGQALPGYVSC